MKIDKNKLDLAMAANCISYEKLSKITGVSQVTIARMKNGSQNPRPITVGKIAKALNVKVEDLIEKQ
jgi:DNA-binding Xre family transcriptional regulator